MVEGMKIQGWRQDDRQSKLTLEFGMWNQKVSVQVYESGNFRNKKYNRNLSDCELKLLEKCIAKVAAGSPETKCSCQFHKYDRESRQFRIDSVIAIEKDSKQVYKMSFTDVTKQSTITFALMAPKTVSMGSEPLSEGNLSALKLETLKEWIINSKIWAPFTYQPPRDGGQRGGGGGYGRPSAPAPAPSAPSNDGGGSDPDDLPF